MLALIAGRGDLPAAVAASVSAPPLICSLEGSSPNNLTPELIFRLETLGTLIGTLRASGVTEICLCGGIDRPAFDPAALDAATLPLVPRLKEALGLGDDGALRVIMSLFEEAGMQVRAAHEIAPHLLPPEGVLTRAALPDGIDADVAAAEAALAEMGRADLGQAVLVRQGRVIAREDDRGTDAILADHARTRGAGVDQSQEWTGGVVGEAPDGFADLLAGRTPAARQASQPRAILYKAPKPGQDRRADLPTIGPQTARAAAAAGLGAIVIEAGGVIVLNRDEVIRRCDDAGIALWVRPA